MFSSSAEVEVARRDANSHVGRFHPHNPTHDQFPDDAEEEERQKKLQLYHEKQQRARAWAKQSVRAVNPQTGAEEKENQKPECDRCRLASRKSSHR